MFLGTGSTLSLRSGVATDPAGNVYVTGGFKGDATFGTNSFSNFGPGTNTADIFVTKYDPDGHVLWARQAGAEGDDNGTGIAVDAETNLYVSGYFQGSTSFGTTNVVSHGDYDVFVAKYTATGNLLWVRTAGGPFRDQANALALDGAGNVCITGEFNLTAAFGSFTLTNVWQDDIFTAKLDKDGNFLWANSGGGLSQDFGFGIAADQTGNVYVTGYLQYTGTFGTISVPPVFGDTWYDIFVAKYNPAGTPVWVRRVGSANPDGGEAIAVDRTGNIYVTGWISGGATFGATNLPIGGSFLAKFDNSGATVWVKVGNYGSGNAITCDGQGNVYVAGDEGFTEYGGADIFAAKYDPSGTLLWRQNAGSSNRDTALGIVLDRACNIYVCGSFQGNDSNQAAHFGSITLTNSSSDHYDNFVAKLESTGVPLDLQLVGGKVRVSWPPLVPGLFLQQSTNLLQLDGWVTLTGLTNDVELPSAASQSFFRLVR